MRIALCPGHHPEKPGARNLRYGLTENFVAKKIIRMLEDLLRGQGHEVSVFEGRLSEKVRKINLGTNGRKFQLAIDLHFNADAETDDTDDKKGHGVMVMHYPSSAARKAQAGAMSSRIAEKLSERDLGPRRALYWGGSNPGTKPDYFVDKTNCPAFIPEPGYIDNNAFCKKFLLDKKGHLRIAKALYDAIEGFENDEQV